MITLDSKGNPADRPGDWPAHAHDDLRNRLRHSRCVGNGKGRNCGAGHSPTSMKVENSDRRLPNVVVTSRSCFPQWCRHGSSIYAWPLCLLTVFVVLLAVLLLPLVSFAIHCSEGEAVATVMALGSLSFARLVPVPHRVFNGESNCSVFPHVVHPNSQPKDVTSVLVPGDFVIGAPPYACFLLLTSVRTCGICHSRTLSSVEVRNSQLPGLRTLGASLIHFRSISMLKFQQTI